jgi:diaminopimelate decarboxylase
MDYFNYKQDKLFAEEVAVSDIAAEYGTPCYIYSRATLERHWRAFNNALYNMPHLICYAVKANSNLAVLNVLAQLGSGFDIVSQGELERVLAAGGDPAKIVFSGVAKTEQEMARALEVGIYCFNIESAAELQRLQAVAKNADKVANIAIRVNPDVDAKTHPYISTGLTENKFGVTVEQALVLYQTAADMTHINIQGIDCHIGSQLVSLEPFLDALDKVLAMIEQLQHSGINIHHLNLGGGLGVTYKDEQPPHPTDYANALYEKLQDKAFKLILEPGRAIAANAGVLVTQVEYLKNNGDKHFAIVDAGMNDLIRPALYGAYQTVIPVVKDATIPAQYYDVVGPVCETGDFIAKNRCLNLNAGDLLAVRGAGAYGFSMSSNYNSRPRIAEVMVDGQQVHLVRQRETIKSLYQLEKVIA